MLRIFLFLVVFTSCAQAASIRVDPSTEQLYIVGKIIQGDFERFTQVLRTNPSDITAVNIVSLGGNVGEAISIGRLIRRLSLATNVPNLPQYAPEARAQVCGIAAQIASSPCTCASACFLVWAAGVARSGNDIHVHRIAFDPKDYGSLTPEIASANYRGAIGQVHQYLNEMEIPESIYEQMVSVPSFDTRLLDWRITATMTWPPSFSEWVTARCGKPGLPNPNWGRCTMEQQWQAARLAVRAYRTSH